MKNKLACIFLLFCFVAPLTVTFLWLNYQKVTVRREVKWKMIDGMDKEDLVLLKFKEKDEKKQLKWHHSEEFEHNGEMYDIVKKEVVADTTYYWCWPDNEETKLNTQLDKLLICALENIPQRKDNQKRVSDFFKSLYHQEKSKTGIVFCQLTQQNLHYSCSSYSSLTFPPPVPPPEIV